MNGKLTAEQVRKAVNGHGNIMDNRLYCDLQAIADELNATLGGDNRVAERLRGIAADMRNIGASSMTPRELFAYWAREVDKAADLADFICGVNPDGLPYGLTMSDDGDLLNWRGENYVRQSALGDGESAADAGRR